MRNIEFWIGELDEDVVIFDKRLQVEESKYLKLWSFRDKDVGSYIESETRPVIKILINDEMRDKVTKSYSSWLATSLSQYLSEESDAATRRKGMHYARRQLGRNSYCHTCATPLTAKLMNVCGRCGWIKCPNCAGCNCPK